MDLSMLNPQQRLAAQTLEGPVLILAGAGSGKTRALTYRAANLMDSGVAPWRILCLTFTNKAAREMRERIASLVGDQAEDAWISTFHSSCARILRRDIEKLGYERSFAIYDDTDQHAVIKDLLRQMNIDEKYLPPREISARISDAKNRLRSPDEWFAAGPRDYRSQQIHDVFVAYEKRLKELNALDFDDLLVRTLELFAQHPPVLESYRDRFRYVMVDEYQDTNYAQYMLVRLLTAQSRNLCVVGDDDQSIYAWRGADIRNILDFEKDYPDATVIRLEQNYRSTANILDAANQVIAHNEGRKEKKLWTEAGDGEPISVFCADNERGEAGWLVSRIKQYHAAGVPYSQIAVLYRTNAQSRVIEEMLVSSAQPRIPYRIFGGVRFYERREIRDIVSYLRVLTNPADDMALIRIINVPKRSIGDSTVQELIRYARQEGMPLYSALAMPPDTLSSRPRKCVAEFVNLMNELLVLSGSMGLTDFVEELLRRTGLRAQYEKEDTDEARSRVDNIMEFVGAVHEFEERSPGAGLADYLENISLVSDIDALTEDGGYVSLMTLHSAKGLEFDTVFITGMEEGLFPSSRSTQDDEKLEEERRLCYVGITRARRKLLLSRAHQRTLYNTPNYNQASRFLDEIPKRLIKDESAVRDRAFRDMPAPVRPSRPPVSRSLLRPGDPLSIPGVQKGFSASPARALAGKPQFRTGDRVMHRKFGEGTVVGLSGEGPGARIRIDFIALGEKEFALQIAPIIKLEEDA